MSFDSDIKDDIDALLALEELSEPITYTLAGFPYTDVDAHYACEGTGALEDSVGSLDIVEQNTVGLLSGGGKFGDARGPLSTTNHFRRSWSSGDAFDIRGQTSITVIGWVRLNSLLANDFFFSIYDASNANGQAFNLYARETSGGAASPRITMFDGLTIFNSLFVKATTSVAIAAGEWQFIGGSYDAVENELRCFWGVDPGEYYYDTASGFAAGFGHTTDYQSVNVGRFTGGGTPVDMDVDHISWWKGRAFQERDFLHHWNDHAGLAFGDFAGGDTINAFVTPGYLDDPNIIGVTQEGLEPPIVVIVSKTDVPTVTEKRDRVQWNGTTYYVKRIVDEDAASRRLYCAK